MKQTHQGYEAGLFHPELGNEVVSGTLFVDGGELRFESESVSETFALGELEVKPEKGGDRLYFRDPSRPDLQLLTLDESILDEPIFDQVREALEAAAVRKEINRRLRITLYFFGACALLVLLVVWASSIAARSIARNLPPELERKFGDEEIEKLRAQGQLIDDTNRVARLAAMAEPLTRVIPTGKTKVQFYIMLDDDPNAFALPGGHVTVTTGLLEMVDEPEELLGVIAHEMAHVTEKHHARKLLSAAGPLVIFQVLLDSKSRVVQVLTTGSTLVVIQGFSREYETEADNTGWDYLVKANIDPRGMIETFRKFKAYQEGKFNGQVVVMAPQAFQSHPELEQRIAGLEGKWKRLSRKSGFRKLEPLSSVRPETKP